MTTLIHEKGLATAKTYGGGTKLVSITEQISIFYGLNRTHNKRFQLPGFVSYIYLAPTLTIQCDQRVFQENILTFCFCF